MFRKTLLAGSALALLSGAAMAAEPVVYVPPVVPPPAPVGPQAMGSVGVSYGIWNLEITDGTDEIDISGPVVDFVGEANIPFGAWNLELEGGGNKIGIDEIDVSGVGSIDDVGLTINTVSAGVHGYYRTPSFAAGIFAEWQSHGLLIDVKNWSLGAEAAFFWGSLMFGVEAAWQNNTIDLLGIVSVDIDSWYAGGDVTYFFTPNAKISGHVRFSLLDISSLGAPDDLDIWSFGLNGEYKFNNSPLAVFVAGRYDIIGIGDALGVPDIDTTAWSLSGGVRVYLGGGPNATLWDHATLGADTFDFSDFLISPF